MNIKGKIIIGLLSLTIIGAMGIGLFIYAPLMSPMAFMTGSAQVPMTPMDGLNFQFLDAARTGNTSLMKTLLAAGADVNATRSHSGDMGVYVESALNNAMNSKKEDSVLLLLDNKVLYEKDILLQDAYRQKYERVIRFALSKNPSREALSSALSSGAAQNDEKKWLKILTDAGVSPNIGLASAVKSAAGTESTQALIELGANVNVISSPEYGYTPIFYTAEHRPFTNRGGEGRDPRPRTQALKAKILIAHGANINQRDIYGLTPFIHAAIKGNIKVMEALLDAGVPVDQRDTRKETNPFESQHGRNKLFTGIYSKILADKAVSKAYNKNGPFKAPELNKTLPEEQLQKIFGHKMANLGLPSDMQINVAKGPFGGTALAWAVFVPRGDTEDTVRFLANRGADLNARDQYGATPLMHAASSEDFAYNTGMFTLLDLKADVHVVDRFGNNAAIYHLLFEHNTFPVSAQYHQHFNQLEGLIAHGVNLDKKNQLGISARSLFPEVSVMEQEVKSREHQEEKQISPDDNSPAKGMDFLSKASPGKETVHLISTHNGSRSSAECLEIMYTHERCSVDVFIEKTDKPIILVLAAYSPIRWKVHNGQNVHKVLLTGHFRQTISGLPRSATIISTSYQDGDTDYFYESRDFPADSIGITKKLLGVTPSNAKYYSNIRSITLK